jgi:hypothetical protein
MSSPEFVLLADLNRRLRNEKWTAGFAPNTWRKGDRHIAWDREESTIDIMDYRDIISRHTTIYVESVRQTVDVLVALDWLPPSLSEAWRLGFEQAVTHDVSIRKGTWPEILYTERCQDCCADDQDPSGWCGCRRGQSCDGPCRQRAHDPRMHTTIPVQTAARS